MNNNIHTGECGTLHTRVTRPPPFNLPGSYRNASNHMNRARIPIHNIYPESAFGSVPPRHLHCQYPPAQRDSVATSLHFAVTSHQLHTNFTPTSRQLHMNVTQLHGRVKTSIFSPPPSADGGRFFGHLGFGLDFGSFSRTFGTPVGEHGAGRCRHKNK